MQNSQSIALLNRLLRGELSAIETYEMALHNVRALPAGYELRRIADDHRAAAETLRQHIRLFGGVPDTTSGAWGFWAKMLGGTASLLGDSMAMKALKEGEEHGLKEYQTVADNTDLATQCRTLIGSDLLSRQRQHISSLDRYMSTLT